VMQMVAFGSPELFQIAACWIPDAEPRDHLPADSGWSGGTLRITVGGEVLTRRSIQGRETDYAAWYLSPIAEWLVTHWTYIFHEQNFTWSDTTGAPAVVAVRAAQNSLIASDDPEDQLKYARVQSWWKRHALRAADSSALYPDVCLRRDEDSIEISWAADEPEYPPQGFKLHLSPGSATLPVEAVARPMWEFLNWLITTAPATARSDSAAVDKLKARWKALAKTPLKAQEIALLGEQLESTLEQARLVVGLPRDTRLVKGTPTVASWDSAVLMFGGLNPQIGKSDAIELLGFLDASKGNESAKLRDAVGNLPHRDTQTPHIDGYELADDLREFLEIDSKTIRLDIRGTLQDLEIRVEERSLQTDSVRGVAIAGKGFRPSILINKSHPFNSSDEGRRFTLAHELCHILHDRTHAKKLSHASGPWTSPRVERRANAFAAMLLASRSALRSRLADAQPDAVLRLAGEFGVSFSTLTEHLYNLMLIDAVTRDRLRAQLGVRSN
jgi:Zn-dependent peptidase ImmA (M78 family)